MPTTSKPIELFYSYSHKDEDLCVELVKHLSILKRQGVIQDWYDRKIGAGKEWEGEIDTHLNTSGIILLLISSDFLASDYCYDIEMNRALERHDAGEARVIPVILRPVDWKGAPFGKLQALPKDAKPVTSWSDPDEAFTNVAQGIRAAVEELAGPTVAKPEQYPGDAPVPQPAEPRPASPPSVDISDNWLIGAPVVRVLRDSVRVARNRLLGQSRIEVETTEPPQAAKSPKKKARKRKK